jgi:general secretion pathway protein G
MKNTIVLRAPIFIPRRAFQAAARGFTLIEILIVATIIALIVGFAADRLFFSGGQAQARLAKARLAELSGYLDLYKLDVGKYPTSQDGLNALLTAPSGVANWNGPYAKGPATIKDPWNNDIIYRSPGEQGRPYELVSLGEDGREGGEGPKKDIKSWE